MNCATSLWGPKRTTAVLHNLSFTLAEGEVLAICGTSGAGKSSLLRLLYRPHAPLSGAVIVEGCDLWQTPARAAARIVVAVLQEQPSGFALTTRDIARGTARVVERGYWGPVN